MINILEKVPSDLALVQGSGSEFLTEPVGFKVVKVAFGSEFQGFWRFLEDDLCAFNRKFVKLGYSIIVHFKSFLGFRFHFESPFDFSFSFNFNCKSQMSQHRLLGQFKLH